MSTLAISLASPRSSPAVAKSSILTTAASARRLFAADQATVFELRGTTWNAVENGLPTFAHCTDLRIANNSQSGRDLFLATYGRSVWRTTISLGSSPEASPKLPELVSEALLGVIQDGAGIVRIGHQLVRIPPRPLAKDLLTGLAIYDLAEAMNSEARTAIQRSIVQQLAASVTRQLEFDEKQGQLPGPENSRDRVR